MLFSHSSVFHQSIFHLKSILYLLCLFSNCHWLIWTYRRDVVGKATSGRRGQEALMSWGPEKMLIRCSKESQHPAEWTPGPLVEHLENEKDTTLTAIRVEVKLLQLCSISSSLSHENSCGIMSAYCVAGHWKVGLSPLSEVFVRISRVHARKSMKSRGRVSSDSLSSGWVYRRSDSPVLLTTLITQKRLLTVVKKNNTFINDTMIKIMYT